MVAPFGNFYCITYPHKTTLSEANVKVNGMGRTKWTYHKACNFASIYFIFLTFCFSLRTCYRNVLLQKYPNVHIHTFRKQLSFIWRYFYPESILKTYSAATIRNDLNTNVSCFMRAVLFSCMYTKTTMRNRSQLFKESSPKNQKNN